MKNKVKERRLQLGKSQKWLAEQTGVSTRYIIKIENQEVNPSVTLAKKIASSLGRLIEELFI